MGTLLGMGLFSAAAALTVDKIYSWAVDSTSTVANVGRYAAFTGTWTAITTASSMRGVSKSATRLRGRIRGVRDLTGKKE